MLADPVLNNLTLVIDALDECHTNRDRLVNFISETTQAKWIVSSRNWPEIDEMLQKRHDKVKIHLELNKTSVSQAVSAFIQIKVEQLADSKKYDDETCAKIEHYLIHLPQG
jgi:predicted GTPase